MILNGLDILSNSSLFASISNTLPNTCFSGREFSYSASFSWKKVSQEHIFILKLMKARLTFERLSKNFLKLGYSSVQRLNSSSLIHIIFINGSPDFLQAPPAIKLKVLGRSRRTQKSPYQLRSVSLILNPYDFSSIGQTLVRQQFPLKMKYTASTCLSFSEIISSGL